MNSKKLLALLLCLALLLLAGCGGKDKATSAGEQAENPVIDEDRTEPAEEETGSKDGSVKELAMGDGYNCGFVMDLPDGFRYDNAWYCYTNDSTGLRAWVSDANFYNTRSEFEGAMENNPEAAKTIEVKDLEVWVYENAAGFYGAESHYFVYLGDYYDDWAGCHLLVSSEAGDMAATQSQEILDALRTIRKEGETVGVRPAAVKEEESGESEGEETPAQEPEEAPIDPYESLNVQFTPEQTGAMSTFVSMGSYAADGDSLYGQFFTSDGHPELVRVDLKKNGAFADVDGYTVLDQSGKPNYVTLCGEDVYYIRGGEGIYKVSKNGGTPELIVADAVEYLQIWGETMYYSDASYTFYSANLDGSNARPVLDKEIYYPYLINDSWMIYQDDADDESLHLRHMTEGTDITLCPIPSYYPVIYGTDLFLKAVSNGEGTMAKIDMTYTPDSMDNFGIEYGDEPFNGIMNISADGYIYSGGSNGLHISRWKEASNASGADTCEYRYHGTNYDVYWELDDAARVTAICVTNKEGGGSQSMPRFD